MSTLSVNNIRAIVSCDCKDTVYENVNLFCRDGLISYIGPEKHDADTVIDGSGMRRQLRRAAKALEDSFTIYTDETLEAEDKASIPFTKEFFRY